MQKFKIASVQLDLSKKPREILKDIHYYMDKAKSKSVDIICFPEGSLGSWPKDNEKLLQIVRKMCKQKSLWCVTVGYLREQGIVYNSAILIDNNGEIRGKHKKVHVCDTPKVKPGETFEIFDTPFCKIGMAICWDISHPDALHTLAKKGASLVFCPMFWNYEPWSHSKNHLLFEKRILQSILLTRAFENLMYVAFSNAFHPTQQTVTSYSGIAEPHRIISEIFMKPGMITSDVDLKYLSKIRNRYKREYNKIIG